MSNFENPFKDFVFSLPEDKLDLLIECINNRKDYGYKLYDFQKNKTDITVKEK